MTQKDFFDIDTTLLSIKPNPANRYLQFFLPEHPLACQNGMAPVSARGGELRQACRQPEDRTLVDAK